MISPELILLHCINLFIVLLFQKSLFPVFSLFIKAALRKVMQVLWLSLSRHVAVCKELHLLCLLSPGLTAAAAAAANAAIAEAMKVKKIKLEAMSSYHSNANHHGADGENGDLSSSVGKDALHKHTPTQTVKGGCRPTDMSQIETIALIVTLPV